MRNSSFDKLWPIARLCKDLKQNDAVKASPNLTRALIFRDATAELYVEIYFFSALFWEL